MKSISFLFYFILFYLYLGIVNMASNIKNIFNLCLERQENWRQHLVKMAAARTTDGIEKGGIARAGRVLWTHSR